ncbi:response regulator receiver modulated CheB methylesterase [Rippkaea orientalis PCC 8801]|uniref:protein-glutamate methylesterase n=1 Tax=Rippkaea orientalis (strain PCC 8801 / RF-1) TaxID=41431 RepID=B7K638_RIPO1|nr:chemotaxis protein CheB [Rippkaea orientalis]ACK68091.1 response regulator receiver modulated CheB methylesterase [Rippkaea orientalis PCC 8801]
MTTLNDTDNSLSLIVGVGASAGGLDAFSELLSHLPTDTGMGFVLVQHLSPGQESLLSELLARTTRMPVATAENGMTVEANHVYVIPPNAQMTIAEGQLQLAACDQLQGRIKTIDVFFESLAADQKNKAIALSGYADPRSIGASLEAGFQEYLSKPVDINELISSVSALSRRQ